MANQLNCPVKIKFRTIFSIVTGAAYLFNNAAWTFRSQPDNIAVSFGIGLGEMNGKAFRIGHLGMLTDVMVLSGLATIEMAMADLDYPITLGAGVTAAQNYFRHSRDSALKSAA